MGRRGREVWRERIRGRIDPHDRSQRYIPLRGNRRDRRVPGSTRRASGHEERTTLTEEAAFTSLSLSLSLSVVHPRWNQKLVGWLRHFSCSHGADKSLSLAPVKTRVPPREATNESRECTLLVLFSLSFFSHALPFVRPGLFRFCFTRVYSKGWFHRIVED